MAADAGNGENVHARSIWQFTGGCITLTAVAISKPLFDKLSENAEFFVAADMGPLAIIGLMALLTLGIPTLLCLPFWIFRHVSAVPAFLVLFVLFLLYVVQLTNALDGIPAVAAVSISGIAAALLSVAYLRRAEFAFVVSVMCPIAILFAAQFAFSSNVYSLLRSDNSADGHGIELNMEEPIPVVLVVLDEMPLLDMLDPNGDIDEKAFPNFALLANQSTWYENATTVAAETMVAVPAILTGQHPGESRLAIRSVHPQNLFSILEHDYAINAYESLTKLSRPREGDVEHSAFDLGRTAEDLFIVYLHLILPRRFAEALPKIDEGWGGFRDDEGQEREQDGEEDTRKPIDVIKEKLEENRIGDYVNFTNSIGEYPDNTLHFNHILIPHRPHRYFPTGTVYTKRSAPSGVRTEKSTKNLRGPEEALRLYHQRHRLQMGLADSLVGQLLKGLIETGTYDKSMIIITSDHGISFREGVPVRHPRKGNLADVMFVPLMIKYPGQDTGVRDDRLVQTVDIVPTICDVLGIEGDLAFDGMSLLNEENNLRESVSMYHHTLDEPMEVDWDTLESMKNWSRSRILEYFWKPNEHHNLYWAGGTLEYVGRTMEELDVVQDGVSFYGIDFEPYYVFGRIIPPDEANAESLRVLGLLNGQVVGGGRPYFWENEWIFSFVIPEFVYTQAEDNAVSLVAVKE